MIRNQTWSPSGLSSAPNQKVPFGSRPGPRGVKVLVPPGQSPRRPSMMIASPSSAMCPAGQLSTISKGRKGLPPQERPRRC